MSDQPNRDDHNEPDWLDEFRELADRELGAGSSCEQVHPIVQQWYQRLLEREPPPARDSVLQAMACLSSEILADAPPDLFEGQPGTTQDDQMAGWIEYILMVGRSFELALQNGELDDL